MRKWAAGGKCLSSARMDGKTVVITGCNTGIGKVTATEIARRGAKVLMLCRDLDKAEATAKEIRLLALPIDSSASCNKVY